MPTLNDARRYRVGALIGRARLDQGVAGFGDAYVQEHLKALGVAAVIGAQSREICDVLGEREVEHVLVKGAAVLARYPVLRGVRSMADVDVLVLDAHFEDARRALRTAGYVRSQDDLTDGSRTETLVHPHGIRASVDLHRLLIEPPILSDATSECLRHREFHEGVWLPSRAWTSAVSSLHAARDVWAKGAVELLDLGPNHSASDIEEICVPAARAALRIAQLRRDEWFNDVSLPGVAQRLTSHTANEWRRSQEVHNLDRDMPRGANLWRHYLTMALIGVPSHQLGRAMARRLGTKLSSHKRRSAT